ncbi:tetratricopeptide repeat protein [Kaistella sp. PBT33-4]|uniref:tetratricopeptide repeat protein n=1 Tax=Kaistella sp. PBT33-4 TaxID=3032000 RepID=UPI0023D7F2ED|nr:tetratricopeptide repeat protein [Kaistella sp. PBT33-4]MDF0720201.1 tetratricopeptide repeat protein [Kaistella sp. PBT33-4]
MKKAISLIIVFVSFNFYGQTLEQKAAEKACECVKEIRTLNDENYIECISKSLTESLIETDRKENFKKISTVDGMKNTLSEVDSIVKLICSIDQNALLEEKTKLYYRYSENLNATNSYKIGKDFMDAENYKLAIEAFQLALKNDPNFVLALDDIAMSYRKINQYEEAIQFYQKSLDIFPEGDFALMNIAVVYNLKHDYKTSGEYYKKLIKFHPNYAEGYYGLGRSFAFLEDYENALTNIIKAHKIYVKEGSQYTKDSQQMIQIIFNEMKKGEKEKDFYRIAKENDVNINHF